MQRDAEPPLHLGEQDDAGREDLGPRTVDAEAAGDVAWRRRLDDLQRLGQLRLAELRAHESACGACAAADGEGRFDRGRNEASERIFGLGVHVRRREP